MYVLPKGLESLWVTARGRGLAPRSGKYGEALVSLIRSPPARCNAYYSNPRRSTALRRRDGNGDEHVPGRTSFLLINLHDLSHLPYCIAFAFRQ